MTHNIGIQIKQKEFAKTFMTISVEKTLALYGLCITYFSDFMVTLEAVSTQLFLLVWIALKLIEIMKRPAWKARCLSVGIAVTPNVWLAHVFYRLHGQYIKIMLSNNTKYVVMYMFYNQSRYEHNSWCQNSTHYFWITMAKTKRPNTLNFNKLFKIGWSVTLCRSGHGDSLGLWKIRLSVILASKYI